MAYDITLNDEKVTTIDPVVTGAAPDFTLTDLNGNQVTLSELTKPVLISVFPDINTSVCSLQTNTFNIETARHKEIDFLSISNNTPDEQRVWCAGKNVDMCILSDTGAFGKAYGLVMPDGPLAGRLARTILVVKNGQITYSEIVTEITHQPDYEAAINATK